MPAWRFALGIKTTAIVPALAYFGWGLGRGRRRDSAFNLAAAAAVFLGPLLPYAILRREQVRYALVGFERLRPVGGYVLWKLLPDAASAAARSNSLILALAALLGLLLARWPGRSFLAEGGAWALVLGQVLLLLLGKALYIWYGLAASVFLFLAAAYGGRSRQTVPFGALLASLLLWILQSGDWVGESVSTGIRVWSAIWVAFLLGLGAVAIRGLLDRSVPRLPETSP